jgi:hypothetical protein
MFIKRIKKQAISGEKAADIAERRGYRNNQSKHDEAGFAQWYIASTSNRFHQAGKVAIGATSVIITELRETEVRRSVAAIPAIHLTDVRVAPNIICSAYNI